MEFLSPFICDELNFKNEFVGASRFSVINTMSRKLLKTVLLCLNKKVHSFLKLALMKFLSAPGSWSS